MITLRRLGAAVAGLALAACTAQPPQPVRSPASSATEVPVSLHPWAKAGFPKVEARGEVSAMSVTGPREAWAGGYQDAADDQPGDALLMRWDGRAWTKIAVPRDDFISVDALDGDGDGGVWIANGGTLARWNAGEWHTYEPFGVARGHYISGLAAGDGRVVMVGKAPQGRLILEWDGTKFTLDQGTSGVLNAVSLERGQIWAVGAEPYGSEKCGNVTPLIMGQSPQDRRDGQGVRALRIPRVPGGALHDVWQAAPDDVWAVGEVSGGEECDTTPAPASRPAEPLVMHYDGAAWKRVELPGWDLRLFSVTVTADGHVWAGGGQVTLAHYDGRRWARERPLSGGREDVVRVRAMSGGPGLWAFGALEAPTLRGSPFLLRREE
ncbi:hypothetical protein [Nonomuraea sp. NPDC050540]|uniref:hypothetical protein n=1 Tax=Nonomuraea sp. NPDC050540 TaxID=3364367 RepID=UPI00379F5ECB